MKKFLLTIGFLFALAIVGNAQSQCVDVEEIDGSPKAPCIRELKVTNGTLSCPTVNRCVLTISGGGGGSPGGSDTNVQFNDSGNFSGVAGFVFDKTSKISLGVAGASVGAIGFRNATSGTITLQPVTGALGTVTLSLPAVTDTLVGLAATQTLSNKTLASPSLTGNINGTVTSQMRYGSNAIAYEDGVGPKFTDSNTGAMLTFNTQSVISDITVNWPNIALTIAGIDVANSWADGVKQTFNPDATNAGLNVGSVAGDPSTPANGDLWYDSTANELTARINGANVSLGGGGGGSPGGSSGQFQFNDAGAFGGTTGVSYASSGAPTVSITGQSTSQLTGYFLGPNTSSTALVGIQLGTGGSSGNFVEYRNSSGTALSVVDSTGAAGFGITSSLGARLHSVAGGSGNAGRFDGAALSANTVLVTRQGGSSTGNLFEAQTSGGTAFFTIANGGQLTASLPVTTGTGATAGFQVTANSLTTGNGHEISSSSVSSGNVVSIAATGTAAASNTKTALSVATSGANATGTQTTYGAQISNISTGTSSTNVALNLSASGGTSNYGAVITNGLVAFGGTAAGNVALNYSGTTLQVRTGDNGNNGNLQVGAVTVNTSNNLNMSGDNGQLRWGTSTDLLLRRAAAAHLAFGTTDAASPVAQTLSVQSVVAGTSNTAGANWTFNASRGTGTGAGGSIIFQTAPAGGSGTSQNSLSAAFTVNGDGSVSLKSVTFANLPTVADAKMIYCSDCTIASPCASGGSGAVAKGINGAWVCN